MGPVSSVIKSLSFDSQAGEDAEHYKERLIFAFKEYQKKDPKFLHTFVTLVEQPGNPIGDFVGDNGLDWPPQNINDITGADGLLSKISEEQAKELSKNIEELLPRFIHPPEQASA